MQRAVWSTVCYYDLKLNTLLQLPLPAFSGNISFISDKIMRQESFIYGLVDFHRMQKAAASTFCYAVLDYSLKKMPCSNCHFLLNQITFSFSFFCRPHVSLKPCIHELVSFHWMQNYGCCMLNVNEQALSGRGFGFPWMTTPKGGIKMETKMARLHGTHNHQDSVVRTTREGVQVQHLIPTANTRHFVVHHAQLMHRQEIYISPSSPKKQKINK